MNKPEDAAYRSNRTGYYYKVEEGKTYLWWNEKKWEREFWPTEEVLRSDERFEEMTND